MVDKIIAAVCLGFGVHRQFLLRRQKGNCEKKRSTARNAMAMLIQDLVSIDDKETRAMIACRTMMSFKAMEYCLTRGRFMCGVDKIYRQKIEAIIQSLRS